MRRAIAIAVALAGTAGAEPNLVLERAPMPRTLRMRPRTVAQVPAPAPKPRVPMPAAPQVSATATEPIEGLEGLRDVRQRVSFSVNLGYQVDGARPNGRAGLGSSAPRRDVDFATLRSYGFGEAFLSTRRVGLQSLETFFAMRFQVARERDAIANDIDDTEINAQIPSPVATWFDRSGYEFRTGWIEVKDFLPQRWGLQKLRMRGGNQFVYGPWILHLDGLHIAYEGPIVTAAAYTGARHSDYTRGDQSDRRPLTAGAELRFDVRGFTPKVPLAIEGKVLRLGRSDETGEDSVNTALLQLDWRPGRDTVVFGQIRSVNGDMASQRVEVRTRYKQVTNLVFDVTHRLIDDWRWDPSLVTRPTQLGDMTEARRYLDLGPVVPQLIASARAGTLIRENIDLLARVAGATDLVDGEEPVNTYSAPYAELGGALEVRLRRQAALGISILRRDTKRVVLVEGDQILDNHGPIDALPDQTKMGEDSFTELGASMKMTLGARRFSAMVEIYGRNTNYAHVYKDPLSPLPVNDVRGGGRFTVDAWVSRRIRLFASYDVSSALDTSPDINGYKSLRMMMSGIY